MAISHTRVEGNVTAFPFEGHSPLPLECIALLLTQMANDLKIHNVSSAHMADTIDNDVLIVRMAVDNHVAEAAGIPNTGHRDIELAMGEDRASWGTGLGSCWWSWQRRA